MRIPKVSNMVSPRTGRPVANQFVIETPSGVKYFQSYDSVIAVIQDKVVLLDGKTWDYSTTTGKYRNQFLGEDKAKTLKKIKTGEYRFEDLNE